MCPKLIRLKRRLDCRVKQGPLTTEELERARLGTKAGKAADFVCILSGTPIPRDYIRDEGKAGRLKEALIAIVAEGNGGRAYLSTGPGTHKSHGQPN